MKQIRNFSIIAHIDHGKSTLADRMLEVTGTVEARKMKEQVLDSMELERERGITIKMQPVRMMYHPDNQKEDGVLYELNLIDTPGHIDFSYEVSRALKAVEGVLLLVDSTQGVQAQTLTTLEMARSEGLAIIPVLTKIDMPHARVSEVTAEIVALLGCLPEDVRLVSGKTGEGVRELLDAICVRIPPPYRGSTPCGSFVSQSSQNSSQGLAGASHAPSPRPSGAAAFRGLIFDFQYSNHRGVTVFLRVFDGSVKKGDHLYFHAAKKTFQALEVGMLTPAERPLDALVAGEIGYIVTGIKEPGIASVGDTLLNEKTRGEALAGYFEPKPVVWASVFTESQDDFTQLRQSLDRLKLSDSSLSYEEESSGILGRGFRCGFLGMLHLEIVTERLKREFNLNLIITAPSIAYEVTWETGKEHDKTEFIYAPSRFPDHGAPASIREPWVRVRIILPPEYLGSVMTLLYDHEGEIDDTEVFGEEARGASARPSEEFLERSEQKYPEGVQRRYGDGRNLLSVLMPLRELMRNFFDKLKNATSGYASLSYEMADMRPAEVERLDVLVAEEIVPAFSRVVGRRRVELEAQQVVEKLHGILPRQLFTTKIQGRAMGRIISSRTISALKKDVTGYLYGGDITRKMKLREKQKKGKKRMQATGKVNIPPEVFMQMVRSE
ncbi:GTP-binding protein [Candidatus Kaiserbacteria bacterium]|nr:GTP-binding protein [Candidatus Kaiserbacteria bacterium]